MKNRLNRFVLIAVVMFLVTLFIAGTAMAETYLTLPLHNDRAEVGTDCPSQPGAYWHFVISPNNNQSAFIVFHLNLGDENTYDAPVFILNGTQWDNVFVQVPSGKKLESLVKAGSTADIVWSNKGPQPASFQLSHTCPGNVYPLTVSKTAQPSFTRTYDWDLDKSADPQTVYSAGGGASDPVTFSIKALRDQGTDSDWVVSGVITVENPNTFDVSGVDLSDTTPGGTCTVTPATVDVKANDKATATYTCTFSANPGSGTNTVTASWADFGASTTSAMGLANYDFGDPTKIVLGSVTVNDSNGGQWTFNDSGSVSYQERYFDPQGTCTPHTNTAKIVETGKTASATVKDCQGANLGISKTAVPSFDRTFAWTISKAADPTQVKGFFGSTATFNYTVQVMHDAGTDGNWKVNGVITVSNPNDWQDVTVSELTDLIDNGGQCAVDTSAGLTIPASGSQDFPYECTYASAPSPADFLNTAVVKWDAAAYHTLNGAASASASGAFGAPTNLVDECAAVNDSYAGALGVVCVGGANPTTFTYSRSIAIPQFDCLSYDNTATFTTNDTGANGSASQTVKVCGVSKTGALTIGYWQNKNGQGIIKSYCAGSAGTSLFTFLTGYNPFKDLTKTSCTDIATYVYNLIKAANASGSSMNAMLKAQMLATALDVYFSDPALGGNRIAAPAPIGGKSVDLTLICATVGSAGGCSGGITENVGPAFGGATSLTVSQLLAYAASQSNSGGSTWYAQVKATQELAKDTFDAINNEVVFAP